jgi:hypothetical protein
LKPKRPAFCAGTHLAQPEVQQLVEEVIMQKLHCLALALLVGAGSAARAGSSITAAESKKLQSIWVDIARATPKECPRPPRLGTPPAKDAQGRRILPMYAWFKALPASGQAAVRWPVVAFLSYRRTVWKHHHTTAQ